MHGADENKTVSISSWSNNSMIRIADGIRTNLGGTRGTTTGGADDVTNKVGDSCIFKFARGLSI
jgi:hypothetical protein